MIRFKGCGLPNVYLADGYHERHMDGGIAYSFSDIGGLYKRLGLAVALSRHDLTGDECRFLRKLLEWSQEKLGSLLGKTSQAVAKWEKGEAKMPRPDGQTLRLSVVSAFSPADLPAFAHGVVSGFSDEPRQKYYFCFAGGQWLATEEEWTISSVAECDLVIAKLLGLSKYSDDVVNVGDTL